MKPEWAISKRIKKKLDFRMNVDYVQLSQKKSTLNIVTCIALKLTGKSYKNLYKVKKNIFFTLYKITERTSESSQTKNKGKMNNLSYFDRNVA